MKIFILFLIFVSFVSAQRYQVLAQGDKKGWTTNYVSFYEQTLIRTLNSLTTVVTNTQQNQQEKLKTIRDLVDATKEVVAIYRNGGEPLPLPSVPSSVPSIVVNQQPPTQRKQQHSETCKLTFSINSGRAGSGYLAALLGLASSELFVKHEAFPVMNGETLKSVKQYGLEPSFTSRYQTKITAIKTALENSPANHYVETSHVFIKTFWDIVMHEFSDNCHINIIVLRRYIPDVIFSMQRLNFDKELPNWYYLSSDQRIAALKTNFIFNDELDRIIGYVLDVEAQVQLFQERFPDVNYIEVRLEDLQTVEGAKYLFRKLGIKNIPSDSAIRSIVGTPRNTHGSDEPGVNSHEEETQIIHRYREFIQRCHDDGIENIPAMPALSKIRTSIQFDIPSHPSIKN